MLKKKGIKHYSAEQIKLMIERGEDRTDWSKVDAGSIVDDPDDIDSELDWTQAVVGIPAPKDHINIRIDHDLLIWFKAQGRGYQTLMNSVLRAFVEAERSRPKIR